MGQKEMRIGYFSSCFPYENAITNAEYFGPYLYGGAPNAAYSLAANMARRGHKIDVFTTSIDNKDSIERYESITTYRYGTNFGVLSTHIAFGMFTKPIKHKVDIIHAHFDIFPGPFAALRCAKKAGVPFILTYHGDWDESYGGLIRRVGLSFCNRYLLEGLLSHAKVIISPSEQYIDGSRFLGRFRDKIIAIPNGINLEDFNITDSKTECRRRLDLPIDDNIILFVGSLSPYKGPDILLRAMLEIVKEVSDAKLVFVGSGELQKELKQFSNSLGLDKYVRFAGFIGDAVEKALYYKSADVFVLPSIATTESFGIVNLEAMACGIPIVASRIGGIPGVVEDGENGLLVPPKDARALADAIIHLLESPDLRNKMAEAGRRKAQNYSWERIAQETEKVYTKVLNRG